MKKLSPAKMLLRILIYCLGLGTVSLGIVLCKKSALGISPISTVPYSLEQALPLTFGQLTMCFHFVNTAIQLAMNREKKNVWKLLMQVPVAFAFSVVIDWFGEIIRIDSTVLGAYGAFPEPAGRNQRGHQPAQRERAGHGEEPL